MSDITSVSVHAFVESLTRFPNINGSRTLGARDHIYHVRRGTGGSASNKVACAIGTCDDVIRSDVATEATSRFVARGRAVVSL